MNYKLFRKSQKGFSVIELMVVVVILSILGTILLRGLTSWSSASRIENDTDAIWSYLQDARLLAFSEKINLDVDISLDGMTISLTPTPAIPGWNYPPLVVQTPFRFEPALNNLQISRRGYFQGNGDIIYNGSYTFDKVPAAYSCVTISINRARRAIWKGGNNCDVI